MAISTNGTVLARVAGALYNTQMSNATYSEVKALDPASLTDALYARDFSSATDAAVATTLVTNLGLTSVAGLVNWVAAQLTAAGAHKGAKIVDLLNGFAQMTADATYGAYATAFNTKVDAALVLSQTAGNAGGSFAASSTAANATFTMTTSLDTFVGGAGNDTFNALIDGTTSAVVTTLTTLDSINGGAGADTLVLNVLNGAGVAGTAVSSLPVFTIAGIETVNIRSAVGLTASTTTWADVTSLNVTQGAAVALTAATTTAVAVSGSTGNISIDGGSSATVSAATATQTVTIGATTVGTGAVAVTHTNQTSGNIAIDGGTSVSVTASKATSATISVGQGGDLTDQPSGEITVTTTGPAYAAADAAATRGTIQTTGGTAVTVNQTATSSAAIAATDTSNAGNGITQSAVTVTGGANTTTVSVTQSAAATAVDAVIAVAGSQETQTVTFLAMAAGETIVVNGLTFTAAKALTAAQAAAAFANLADGTSQGSSPAGNGVYSGTFNTIAGTTGAVTTDTTNGSTVTFTSKSKANIAGLTISDTVTGTVAVTTTVDGAAATDAVTGVLGVTGGAVVVNGAITGADKMTTVTLNGFGASSTVASDALTTLNLSNSNKDVAVTNATATTLALNLNAVGTSTANASANLGSTYTALNITASGANSDLDITAGGVTALAVNGSKSVVLTGSTLGALKTVAVTESAGVTMDASGSTVTAVTTAGSTGTNTITVDATKATYTGGAGVDAVTLSATAPSKAVSLDAGDDSLTLATGTTTATANLSGGDGTDTLVMAAADAASASSTDSFQTKFDGFEKLSLGIVADGASNSVSLLNMDNIGYVVSAGTAVTSARETFTVTLAGTPANGDTLIFDGVTTTYADVSPTLAELITAAAAKTYTNWNVSSSTATTITFAAKTAGNKTNAAASDFTGTAKSGSSVTTTPVTSIQGVDVDGALTITKMANGGTLELTAVGSGATVTMTDATGTADSLNVLVKNTAGINAGTVTAAGVESINLTVTDTTTTAIGTHTLSLADTALKTVVVTGNAGLTLTTNSAALTSVDGSALTAALTATTNGTVAQTILGGAGADSLTAAGTSDVLNGGAGADTLTATGDLASLTGGAGADVFNVADATTNVNSYATIVDLAAGDTIKFNNTGATESFASAKIVLGDTAVFQDYANAAISANDGGAISWFQYSGNTYVIEHISSDASTSFVNGSDVVVKIAGLVDLSTASFSSSTQTLVIV